MPANEGSWTINKAVISIVWSQKASNSGVYDGFSQGVEAAITGIVPNETVAFIFPAASNTYEYTDISMTAAVNGVYDFTSINSGNYAANISGIDYVWAAEGHQYPDYVSKNNYSLNVSGVSSYNISRR